MTSTANQTQPAQPSIARSAFMVAAAIFVTRIFGLVREAVFARYFGLSGVADAIFSLLALVTSLLVLVGVVATPLLVDVIAPGFHDERRALAIQLVRVFFPGVGFLVMSA